MREVLTLLLLYIEAVEGQRGYVTGFWKQYLNIVTLYGAAPRTWLSCVLSQLRDPDPHVL